MVGWLSVKLMKSDIGKAINTGNKCPSDPSQGLDFELFYYFLATLKLPFRLRLTS